MAKVRHVNAEGSEFQ